MFSRSLTALIATAVLSAEVLAHTVITYPGWRGDNLITNDTFPYGMQWMYPCEYFFLVRFGLVFSEVAGSADGVVGCLESAKRNIETKHFISSFFQQFNNAISYFYFSC
jgi:hypothetical protein